MISFDKLYSYILSNYGFDEKVLYRDKVLNTYEIKKLVVRNDASISTINKICRYLNCQPGDIMEYIPD